MRPYQNWSCLSIVRLITYRPLPAIQLTAPELLPTVLHLLIDYRPDERQFCSVRKCTTPWLPVCSETSSMVKFSIKHSLRLVQKQVTFKLVQGKLNQASVRTNSFKPKSVPVTALLTPIDYLTAAPDWRPRVSSSVS